MLPYTLLIILPRIPISRTRFRWKTEPWKNVENILSIWMYCHKGILSFELEIDPSVQLPKNKPALAKTSIHKTKNNYIRVKDPQIISQMGSKVKSLSVKGALGKGVILGDIKLEIEGKTKIIPILSTLNAWQEWKSFINQGVPQI